MTYIPGGGGGGSVSDGDKGDIVVSGTGANWNFDSGVVTTFARTFLDDVDAAAVRTTIGAQASGSYQTSDSTLTSLAAFNTNGLIAQTAADTFAGRTLTAPAAGITITNPAGTAGNPTFALANDLAALEALSGTDTIYYRSAADTWTAVTIGSGLSFSSGSLSSSEFGGWTTLTADGTASIMGGTYKKWAPTFAMADDNSIEIEAVLEKIDPNVNAEIAVHDGTNQIRLAYQSDGNRLFYHSTGSGTATGATGSTDLRPGACRLYLMVSVENSSQVRIHGMIDDQRIPTSNSSAISINYTASTLTVYTTNITVRAIRARKIS